VNYELFWAKTLFLRHGIMPWHFLGLSDSELPPYMRKGFLIGFATSQIEAEMNELAERERAANDGNSQ